MAAQKISPDNTIFALDIGTRTVIGLVAVPDNGRLQIAAQCLVEHSRRTMQDGQIHDIPGVAEVVRAVRADLEKQLGFPLSGVAIAAAGRSLITRNCRVEQEVPEDEEIDRPRVNALEAAAVQQARRELAAELSADDGEFTCVGYSVVSYYLDGYAITNLVGHRGRIIAADVLATFLPDSVVNSLYAVLARTGLEPLSLTLEPIAAIEVAIPENYRLLNLALVDIGAGTSDIAVTRDGAITAYGMVPLAGDEISEEIMQSCLVDFDTAERMKRELSRSEDIRYTDITGLEETISRAELLSRIEPVLERLTREVADQIRAANGGRPPRTVFCVGGGSQVPGLTEKLARHLELDPKRVVLRDRRALGKVLLAADDPLGGPEGITVAGIAMVALRRLGHNFIHVMVNGVEHRLFNAREFTVAGVLGLIGFNPRLLIGHNGQNLRFTLNDRPQVIYGGLSRPAEILVNDRPASMQARVEHGDRIQVRPAENGADARITAAALAPAGVFKVHVEGEEVPVAGRVLINGRTAAPEEEIQTGDRVELCAVLPLEEWWREYATARGLEGDTRPPAFAVNGRPVDGGYRLRPGDRVSYAAEEMLPDEAVSIPAESRPAADGVAAPSPAREHLPADVADRAADRPPDASAAGPVDPFIPPPAHESRPAADGAAGTKPPAVADTADTAGVALEQPPEKSAAGPGQPLMPPAHESRPAAPGTGAAGGIGGEHPAAGGPGKSPAPGGNGAENSSPPHGEKTITVTVNGRPVVLSGRRSYIFIDIFNHLEIDLSEIKPPVVVTLNGHEANYTEPLQDGDAIGINYGKK